MESYMKHYMKHRCFRKSFSYRYAKFSDEEHLRAECIRQICSAATQRMNQCDERNELDMKSVLWIITEIDFL